MADRSPPRVCFDRVDLGRPRSEANRPKLRLAVPVEKKWANGRTLRVAFLDGATALHEEVSRLAEQWTLENSLSFAWGVPGEEADIRITFEGSGDWSQVGTDARSVKPGWPTMCLGSLAFSVDDTEVRQTVLHEFGHALGAIHEHQSPASGIPWDRPAVYEFYSGPPTHWSPNQVEENVITRYNGTLTQYTEFDPESIMIYPIPEELTVGGYSVEWGTELSAMDKEWIGVCYPTMARDPFKLEVDGAAVLADIGEHAEWDEFHFTLGETAEVVVETHGPTDLVMALAGPDDAERLVAQDDDSGHQRNARIRAVTQAGTYVVRVWHHWPTGVGPYEVTVKRSTG